MPRIHSLMYLSDMRCDDSRKRIVALAHIELIASHFDLERSVSELIPFLYEFREDSEEVLLQFCEALEVLAKFIKRKRGDISDLVPLFEVVLISEDRSVAEIGINKLIQITRVTRFNSLFDLVQKLLEHGSDMAVVSAIRICCRLINSIPERRYDQIEQILENLSHSPRLFVRAELAKELQVLILEAGTLERVSTEILRKLTNDPQEAVLVAAVQSWCNVSVSKPYFFANVFPILKSQINSPSWRVRYTIACGFPSIIAKAFPSENSSEIIQHIIKYIQDEEIEVAIKTIEVLKSIFQYIAQKEFEVFLPAFQSILENQHFDIRHEIATSLPSIASGELGTSSEIYLSILETLLKDSRPEIPMQLFENFEPIWNKFHKNNLRAMIKPILINLLSNESWTIRQQAVVCLDKITQKLGESFASDAQIVSSFKSRLSDNVFKVRNDTILLLKSLSTHFGRDYAEKVVLPIFQEFQNHKNYLFRINYLKGISSLAQLFSLKALLAEVQTVKRLCFDKVPNVRQQSLATLTELYLNGNNSLLEETVKEVIEKLEDDLDQQVQHQRNHLIGSIKESINYDDF